ncbi:MAG: hypothetical protein NY202_04850 [Mollicutes bacterium UO1]
MTGKKPARYNAEAAKRKEERDFEKEQKEIMKEIAEFFFPRGEESKMKDQSSGHDEGDEDLNLEHISEGGGVVCFDDKVIGGKEGDKAMTRGDNIAEELQIDRHGRDEYQVSQDVEEWSNERTPILPKNNLEESIKLYPGGCN